MKQITIGFIGFGLIGGSIAKAMKASNPNCFCIAYNYHEGSNESLTTALQDGILDQITTELSSEFAKCRILFLCAPVLRNIAYVKELKPFLSPNCILTDVGSVKSNIEEAVISLSLDENFIGGHPMTGSEKTGYHNSHERLLENAYYILTPTDKTKQTDIDTMVSAVISMGAIPILIPADKHDDITAAISHVPHIIASALVQMVKESDDENSLMATLAAGGFKDITRIASASPKMWQDICLSNTKSIRKFLQKYIKLLLDVDALLLAHDQNKLYHFFSDSKEFRDSIPGKSSGILTPVYEVYVDIPDETGAIATIAGILAKNHISMQNIGILHNREWEEGVLKIEFYEKHAAKQAADILKEVGYQIYASR